MDLTEATDKVDPMDLMTVNNISPPILTGHGMYQPQDTKALGMPLEEAIPKVFPGMMACTNPRTLSKA